MAMAIMVLKAVTVILRLEVGASNGMVIAPTVLTPCNILLFLSFIFLKIQF